MKRIKVNKAHDNDSVLCFVNMNAHYPMLKDISLALREEFNAEVKFYFYSSLFDLTKEIGDAKSLLFDSIENNKFNKTHTNLTSYKPFESITSNNIFTSIYKKIKENKRKIKEMNEVINNINPSFVLISDNTINYDISLFVKVCEMNKINVFCIPFGLIVPNCILERLKKNALRNPKIFMKSIISSIFPKYILKKEGNIFL